MSRMYFTINESNARIAHEMQHFDEYTSGSMTESYQKQADAAYDLADKIAERHPNDSDYAYYLAERYSKKLCEYYNREISISMMCPSVMISGRGNFPVTRHKRQIAAMDRNYEFYQKVQGILTKLQKILNGSSVIRSNDEHAIEKLEAKLSDLQEFQERMKSANRAVRLKDTEHGNDLLREMGYSEEEIKLIRKPDCFGKIGYPSYMLTNNNASIHRVSDRLKELKSAKEQEYSEHDYGAFCVVENTDIMRYQIIFTEKPDENVRDILKSNGFRWAPSQNAWQRQITSNGKYAFDRVVEQLIQIFV